MDNLYYNLQRNLKTAPPSEGTPQAVTLLLSIGSLLLVNPA
jgi:hypothetical protein